MQKSIMTKTNVANAAQLTALDLNLKTLPQVSLIPRSSLAHKQSHPA
jgi:hypothetical protein